MPIRTDSVSSKHRPAGRIYDQRWTWSEIQPIGAAQVRELASTSEDLATAHQNVIAESQRTLISDAPADDKRTCRLCTCSFATRDEQTAHFRSDWHRHNLHLSLRAKEPISEQQFDELVSDDDISTDSDSNSGEDNETDDASPDFLRQSSQLHFAVGDQVYSVYKRALPIAPDTADELKRLGERPNIVVILLLAAGRFAGAIYEDGELIEHKTFQRYTVRAKQGGAQSAQDGKRAKAPKSAGAALRRYNEQALAEDIFAVLTLWKALLDRASVIFLRCSTYQRHIFFGDSSSASDAFFSKNDQRVRTIPFVTRRPTLDEAKRVFDRLVAVYYHGSAEEFSAYCSQEQAKKIAQRNQAKRGKQSSRKAKERTDSSSSSSDTDSNEQAGQNRPKKAHSRVPKEGADKEADPFPQISPVLRQKLYTAIRTDDKSDLMNLIDEDGMRDSVLEYLSQVHMGMDQTTFLHETASRGSADMLRTLLDLDCDPTVKNAKGQVPYQVAMNRPIKQIFVEYRVEQSPDRWDWAKALIPLPVEKPVDVDPEREAAAAEKKRRQKQQKREREKVRKAEETKQRSEQEEQQRYLALSDREKRALAAERRMLQMSANTVAAGGAAVPPPIALSRCFQCAADITGKVPFEYSSNRFCSTRCVRLHRSQ